MNRLVAQGALAERTQIKPSILMMFGVILLSYAVNAMDRMVFPLLASDIRQAHGFSVAGTGLIATIFTLGMALAGWPTGILLSRYSRKTVLQIGALIFSAGTVSIALAHGFLDMLVYRTATGVGEVMQQMAIATIATTYFVRARALAVSITQVAFGLGNFSGPLLAAAAVSLYGGWQGAFFVFGAAGFAMMALIAIFVRPHFTEVKAEITSSLRIVGGADRLWNRNTVVLSIIALLTGLILYGYLGLYSTFLREHLRFAPKEVAVIMCMFGLGGLLAPIGGWLGDRLPQRNLLAMGYIGLSIFGYLLFNQVHTVAAHCVLSLCWGFTHSGVVYVNLWGAQIKAVKASLNARATGLFITCLYTTSAFGGYLMGFLVTKASWGMAAILQLSSLAALCAVLCLFIRSELMSRPQHD
ncbi:MFS transporter [Paraburkholderia agricolaris]|uniref:MFS transporter n=1 Tax=Paraburkholderia agricolaris TaxID=2152888 RepID=UPI0012922EA9|nr:MFS transporter [Paraburkholderia agricolaris]